MGPKETTDSIGMPCVSRSYHRLSIGSTSKFMLIFPCQVFLYKLDGKKGRASGLIQGRQPLVHMIAWL